MITIIITTKHPTGNPSSDDDVEEDDVVVRGGVVALVGVVDAREEDW